MRASLADLTAVINVHVGPARARPSSRAKNWSKWVTVLTWAIARQATALTMPMHVDSHRAPTARRRSPLLGPHCGGPRESLRPSTRQGHSPPARWLPGVVVTPFAVSDPTWPAFMEASTTRVAQQFDRCITVPTAGHGERIGEVGGAQRLAVFAVDFTRISGRQFVEVVPLCGRGTDARPRPAIAGGPADGDSLRVREALYRLRASSSAQQHPGPLAGAKRRRR